MWSEGDVVVRREVLNDGRCWCQFPVRVVQDKTSCSRRTSRWRGVRLPARRLADRGRTASLGGKDRSDGNGVLMLQRPGEAYAIWVFWFGPERAFHGWYVNLQEPFRRNGRGYDTQDHELDIWVPAEGAWVVKDDELLDVRVREGRFTHDQALPRRSSRITLKLDAGRRWWDDAWASWRPVWSSGELVTLRFRSIDGRFYSGRPLRVIEHTPELLVTFMPENTVVSDADARRRSWPARRPARRALVAPARFARRPWTRRS